MFDNIVVGVRNDEAALYAVALAKVLMSSDAALTLVHVETGHGQEPAVTDDGSAAVHDRGMRAPVLSLPDAANAAGDPLVVVRASAVGAGLHDYAVRAGADLLVVGASGRGRLRRTIGHDDTSAVLRHPPCSLAIAPAGYAGGPGAVRTLAVGYDGSIASDEALALARRLAADHHATLSAFEAVTPLMFADPLNQRRGHPQARRGGAQARRRAGRRRGARRVRPRGRRAGPLRKGRGPAGHRGS